MRHLDQDYLSHYRPISKLSFKSTFNIFDTFQSSFRSFIVLIWKGLLKVINDTLLCIDSGFCGILIMLDLSAAFHTIDHDIRLQRLDQVVGFKGVQRWYLNHKYVSVNLGIVSHHGLKSPMVSHRALFWVLFFFPYICFHSYNNLSYYIYAEDC